MIRMILFLLLTTTFAFAAHLEPELTPAQRKAEIRAVIKKAKANRLKNPTAKMEKIAGIITAVNIKNKKITVKTYDGKVRTIGIGNKKIRDFYVDQKIKALIRGKHIDVRIIKKK